MKSRELGIPEWLLAKVCHPQRVWAITDEEDSPKHKRDLGAAHGRAWGPAEQGSGLDSMVLSLLNQADNRQTSHPSASFLLSLCGPACPWATTHQRPCVQPQKILLSHTGAPCRQKRPWQPVGSSSVFCCSITFTESFRIMQPVPCRGRIGAGCPTHFFSVWGQNLTQASLQMCYAQKYLELLSRQVSPVICIKPQLHGSSELSSFFVIGLYIV